jgi:hypothetical protein
VQALDIGSDCVTERSAGKAHSCKEINFLTKKGVGRR